MTPSRQPDLGVEETLEAVKAALEDAHIVHYLDGCGVCNALAALPVLRRAVEERDTAREGFRLARERADATLERAKELKAEVRSLRASLSEALDLLERCEAYLGAYFGERNMPKLCEDTRAFLAVHRGETNDE